MLDKTRPEFWRDIKPGSTITISDSQAIEDSIGKGTGVKGTDYIVESILKISAEGGIADWLLFKLDDEDQELWLLAKIVDAHTDLVIYFEPDEFQPGNRKDLVDNGDTWIFFEPENPDDFEFDELEFVSEIIWNVETGEGDDAVETEVIYRMKSQGVLYGACTHDPVHSGIQRIMAGVAEYRAETDYDNPELLLLELGGERGNVGGLITMMVGSPIKFIEVDVLKAQLETPVVRKKSSLWEKMLKKMS